MLPWWNCGSDLNPELLRRSQARRVARRGYKSLQKNVSIFPTSNRCNSREDGKWLVPSSNKNRLAALAG